MKIKGMFLTIAFSIIMLSVNAQEQIFSAQLITKAESGDPKAENDLGYCYQFGKGVEKNLDLAFEWYKKSADQNDPDGLFNFGMMHFNGYWKGENEYFFIDKKEGINYLQQAKFQGNKQAVEILSKIESSKDRDWFEMPWNLLLYETKNYNLHDAETINLFQTKKNKLIPLINTNPLACFYLGILEESRENYAMALSYFHKSFNMFHPNGKFDLKRNYINPITNEKYSELSELEVHNKLGYYYENGIGCEKDYDKAIYYYTHEDGCGEWLGYVLESVRPKIRGALIYKKSGYPTKCFEILSKPKLCEEPEVLMLLGESYLNGYGTQQNYSKAFECYHKIIDSRFVDLSGLKKVRDSYPDLYADSCYRLYEMYLNGLGIEKDIFYADAYFDEALRYGNISAMKKYMKEF